MPAYTIGTEKVPTKPQHHTTLVLKKTFIETYEKKFICTLLFKHFCIKIDK